MEKILNNMILISEVAELSAAAADELPESTGAATARRRRGEHVRWSSLRFDDKKTDDLIDDGDDDDEENDSDLGNSEAESKEDEPKQGNLEKRGGYNKSFSGLSPDTSFRNFRIKNLLGRWDDPLNKMDKVMQHFPCHIQSKANAHDIEITLATTIIGFRYFEVSKSTDIHGSGAPIL